MPETKKTAHLDSAFDFEPYQEDKDEEYMNPKMETHFLSILENWRDELLKEVDKTVSHMQDDATNYPDPNDRASQESDFGLELRARDRERKLVKKIEKTIALFTTHDYGYCEACGIEIGVKRLEARPTADKCIDCKTLDEIKERQRI